MIPNYPLTSHKSLYSIEFGHGLRANGVGKGWSGYRILSSRPTSSRSTKVERFFCAYSSGTRSGEKRHKKTAPAQSAGSGCLLRPPTPRISERMRANPVMLSKLIISSIQNFATVNSRSEPSFCP